MDWSHLGGSFSSNRTSVSPNGSKGISPPCPPLPDPSITKHQLVSEFSWCLWSDLCSLLTFFMRKRHPIQLDENYKQLVLRALKGSHSLVCSLVFGSLTFCCFQRQRKAFLSCLSSYAWALFKCLPFSIQSSLTAMRSSPPNSAQKIPCLLQVPYQQWVKITQPFLGIIYS